MASIKDVAKRAGVSFSTVSIVINGKANERKLSPATQKKVWDAVKDLNYHPNISARNLRATSKKKTVALFWTTDFREVMCSRFLAGLNSYIRKNNLEYEIVVRPYEPDKLEEELGTALSSTFNAAIVATATPNDIAFLESSYLPIPIILYNRRSEKYSSVRVDDTTIGKKAAKAFKDTKHKNVALVSAPYVFEGMRVRDLAFIEACKKSGINVVEYQIDGNGADAGFEVAGRIDFTKIDAVYLPNDTLAIGLRRFCFETSISIPDDVSILSIGNGLPLYSTYSVPSMSVIDIPMEAMAAKALELLDDFFSDFSSGKVRDELFEAPLILRESIKTV